MSSPGLGWVGFLIVHTRTRFNENFCTPIGEAVRREFVGEYGKGVRQENVRSKTKELTGTLPYAISMRPSVITASSVDCQDVTTACQIKYANVVLQG